MLDSNRGQLIEVVDRVDRVDRGPYRLRLGPIYSPRLYFQVGP